MVGEDGRRRAFAHEILIVDERRHLKMIVCFESAMGVRSQRALEEQGHFCALNRTPKLSIHPAPRQLVRAEGSFGQPVTALMLVRLSPRSC